MFTKGLGEGISATEHLMCQPCSNTDGGTQFLLGAWVMFTNRRLTLKDFRDMRLGGGDWKWLARESTIAAVCQIAAVPVGPHSAALWRTVSRVVHPPQTANARDVIGQNNHDCCFCFGIAGKFSPPLQWTQIARGPCENHVRRVFLRTGLNACLTSGAPIPIIRLKIHHHMG